MRPDQAGGGPAALHVELDPMRRAGADLQAIAEFLGGDRNACHQPVEATIVVDPALEATAALADLRMVWDARIAAGADALAAVSRTIAAAADAYAEVDNRAAAGMRRRWRHLAAVEVR
jgi:hypothetical protein